MIEISKLLKLRVSTSFCQTIVGIRRYDKQHTIQVTLTNEITRIM